MTGVQPLCRGGFAKTEGMTGYLAITIHPKASQQGMSPFEKVGLFLLMVSGSLAFGLFLKTSEPKQFHCWWFQRFLVKHPLGFQQMAT